MQRPEMPRVRLDSVPPSPERDGGGPEPAGQLPPRQAGHFLEAFQTVGEVFRQGASCSRVVVSLRGAS